MKNPEHMTLRILLAKLQQQSPERNMEDLLDMPLCVGLTDDYTNFATATISTYGFPNLRAPEPAIGFKGSIRLECHLNGKALREINRKGK